MYDYIIKGGTLLNVDSDILHPMDIGILGSRIAKIGVIPETEGSQIINAVGCIVSPGLIDLHIHLHPLCEIGVYAEAACFSSGVTTAVDCGSAGVSTYPLHRASLYASHVRTFAFLNVCSAGLATRSYLENVDPQFFNQRKIEEQFAQWGGTELLGLKVRHGAEIVGSLGLEPLKATIRIAEKLGVPVMVHCSNPPCPMDDLISLLRPGDILTHAYQDAGSSILDASGHVSAATKAARERGVIFDVANANPHFSFNIARQAIGEGFLPDTISTDLTKFGLFRRPNAFNLLHIMSKYLNMGLTVEQVFERVTTTPAKIIGHPELAILAEGHIADISIIKKVSHTTAFGDRLGEIMEGDILLKSMMTFREGLPVYRDQQF